MMQESPSASIETQNIEVEWGRLSGEIDRLEQMEFANNNPAQAAKGYQALLSRSLTPVQKVTLHKMLAGSTLRLNNSEDSSHFFLVAVFSPLNDEIHRNLAVALVDAGPPMEQARQTLSDLARSSGLTVEFEPFQSSPIESIAGTFTPKIRTA